MTGGTKGGVQRACSLRPRCVGEVDLKTVTHIYLSISMTSEEKALSVCRTVCKSVYTFLGYILKFDTRW
jgi:hypothetical protein